MSKQLDWRGDQVEREIVERLKRALGEIGLRIETEAKRALQPGHGVLTGTLRRSIHAAEPDYAFAGDDVKAGPGTPERGGRQPSAERRGDYLQVAVGSGLEYAMAIHQGGWGGFGGYHYIQNAVEKVAPQAEAIIRKHVANG